MIEELVCSSVALVLYLNTLGADFCYDDSRVIKTNQDLLPETPWTNIFYDDFWGTLLTHSGSHKSYRPLCTLSFRLNHALGGLEPWGYHLVNVTLHAAVTWLFTGLSRLLLGEGRWALLAGLLFASHPVHTEAVAGVVGRADVGAGLFFLLSLLCYARHCALRPGSVSAHWLGLPQCWVWLMASLVLAAGSMLWKEQGVTVLAVSATYDLFIFHRLRFRQVVDLIHKRKNLGLLLSVSLLATWGAVLLAVRLYWMGNKPPSFSNSDNPAADSPSFLTRTLTFLYLPAANMWLLLCPDTLSFDWSMDALPLLRTYTDWRNLHTIAFYVGFLLLALVGLRDLTKVRESNGKVHVSNGKLNTNGHSNHLTPEHASSESLGPVKSVENGTKTTAC
ncbi:hypothetical protein AGOR_G00248850 [Albula goreensis]|uniref:DUF1736 domain-containing protein n=1 Tax=Albula goreensis TaxID=1534307 RepID=A0A8T3CEI5_9TELE|nr:hypothetical protein AGOR_G00248850 [Albula goreensis]